jgi:hypothetical protein
MSMIGRRPYIKALVREALTTHPQGITARQLHDWLCPGKTKPFDLQKVTYHLNIMRGVEAYIKGWEWEQERREWEALWAAVVCPPDAPEPTGLIGNIQS